MYTVYMLGRNIGISNSIVSKTHAYLQRKFTTSLFHHFVDAYCHLSFLCRRSILLITPSVRIRRTHRNGAGNISNKRFHDSTLEKRNNSSVLEVCFALLLAVTKTAVRTQVPNVFSCASSMLITSDMS